MADDPRFNVLTMDERKAVFKEFVRKLRDHEEAEKQRAIEERLARERAARDPFRDRLVALVQAGDLNVRSSWEDVLTKVSSDHAYEKLLSVFDAAEGKVSLKFLLVFSLFG